jgi:multiple sugar transport system substrate-binding protein
MQRVSRRELLKSAAWLTGGVVAAGLMGACAPTTQPSAPADEPAAAEPEAEGAPAELASADLNLWIWWPDPVVPMQESAEDFMAANPAVDVTIEAPTDYWTKLQTAIAGGAGPEIFAMRAGSYRGWVARDVLRDLTPLVDRDPEMQEALDASLDAAVDFYNYDGQFYAMPLMYTSIVVYYNEDYFNELGLTPLAEMDEDWDWDMWREFAMQCHRMEGDDVQMWGTYIGGTFEGGWLDHARANGGDFFSEDFSECIVDQPPTVEAVEFLRGLKLDDGLSPSSEAMQAENVRSMFMTGKIAIWPGGSWVMNTLNAQLTDFTYNIGLMPKAPTGERNSVSNMVSLVMNVDAEAMEQSWALMKHLLSKEAQDALAVADVLAPARNDSAELYYSPELGPDNRTAAFEMAKLNSPLPDHPQVTLGEWYQPMGEWTTEIYEGRSTAEEGLQEMAAAVNDLIEEKSE